MGQSEQQRREAELEASEVVRQARESAETMARDRKVVRDVLEEAKTEREQAALAAGALLEEARSAEEAAKTERRMAEQELAQVKSLRETAERFQREDVPADPSRIVTEAVEARQRAEDERDRLLAALDEAEQSRTRSESAHQQTRQAFEVALRSAGTSPEIASRDVEPGGDAAPADEGALSDEAREQPAPEKGPPPVAKNKRRSGKQA